MANTRTPGGRRIARTETSTLRPQRRRMGRPPTRIAGTTKSWFLALRDWGCSLSAAAGDVGLTLHSARRLDVARSAEGYSPAALPPGFAAGIIRLMPARRRAALVRKVLARRAWRQKRIRLLADAMARSAEDLDLSGPDAERCAWFWLSQGRGLNDDDYAPLDNAEKPFGPTPRGGLAATPWRARLVRRWDADGRPSAPPPEQVETVEQAVAYVITITKQATRTNRYRQLSNSRIAT